MKIVHIFRQNKSDTGEKLDEIDCFELIVEYLVYFY